MLTKEDLQTLQRPFDVKDHEFLKQNAYITESAITKRIETVDPSWTLEQINIGVRRNSNTNAHVAFCTVRLTICGVSRDGVGMADVTLTKSGTNEANEAEKSAATDAMKRAARLFGIGRYLLELPGYVVDAASMAKFLLPSPQRPALTSSADPVWFGVAVGEAWKDIKDHLLNTKVYTNEHEMKASMAKRGVVVDNKIADEWKVKLASELVQFLKTRHEEPKAS